MLYLLLLLPTLINAGRIQQCMTTYFETIYMKHAEIIPSDFGPSDNVELYFTLHNVNNTINAGFIHYTIVDNGEEYVPQVDDLCTFINCPINLGTNDRVLKFTMPNYLRPIVLYIELMDYTGKTFGCIRLKTYQTFWSWLTALVTATPKEPVANVRKMLRGREDVVQLEFNVTHENTIGPTAGMRPSSSSVKQ